ncbi:ABC1 family-domain-containing protein [Chytriomyces sp. MP71]|nr:ABC1 family-domain-containing protein [Chytriomyces sp. MP71]
MSRLRLLVVGTSALVGAPAAYVQTLDKDDGLRRTIRLWTEMGPVIGHYRTVELKHKILKRCKEEENREWAELDEMYSGKVLDTLQGLRGFYIKVGQLMAHRNDVLSKTYIEKLRGLEDQVPPLMDGPQAREVVRSSLGLKNLEDVFLDFQDVPLGSASIGQVHKATLKSTGEPVAVKIQSPGAEELFKSDLQTARTFCKVFIPEQVIIFDEIEKQFVNEFDYRVEASHLTTMHANMTPTFGNLVVVPLPFTHLCSREVLTMQFLKGKKLVDGIRDLGRDWCVRNGTTLEQYEAEMRERYEQEGLPPVYAGPSPRVMDLWFALVRARDAISNVPRWMWNYTVGWVAPREWLLPYQKSFLPFNTARVMDTLLKVHGKQVLLDGFLNGDPHPGNFLLLEDGRLGMLDMGQIKILSTEERLFVARLYKALADEDRAELKRLSIEGGYKSKFNDQDVIFKMARVGFDQDGRQVTDGLNLQQFADKMYRIDPWEKTLDALIMPMRVSLLIRGVGLMLNHPVSVAHAWRPFAEQALREAGDK